MATSGLTAQVVVVRVRRSSQLRRIRCFHATFGLGFLPRPFRKNFSLNLRTRSMSLGVQFRKTLAPIFKDCGECSLPEASHLSRVARAIPVAAQTSFVEGGICWTPESRICADLSRGNMRLTVGTFVT